MRSERTGRLKVPDLKIRCKSHMPCCATLVLRLPHGKQYWIQRYLQHLGRNQPFDDYADAAFEEVSLVCHRETIGSGWVRCGTGGYTEITESDSDY